MCSHNLPPCFTPQPRENSRILSPARLWAALTGVSSCEEKSRGWRDGFVSYRGVVPAIVLCWGEPLAPWELFPWCFLGAASSRHLNKPTPGKHWSLWPWWGVLTCQNETLTPSSCLQDMLVLAGEPWGRAAAMSQMQMLLGRCLAAPQELWHGGDPCPTAPPPLGAGTTCSPRGWCRLSSFPLAAPRCSATIDYFWMS